MIYFKKMTQAQSKANSQKLNTYNFINNHKFDRFRNSVRLIFDFFRYDYVVNTLKVKPYIYHRVLLDDAPDYQWKEMLEKFDVMWEDFVRSQANICKKLNINYEDVLRLNEEFINGSRKISRYHYPKS